MMEFGPMGTSLVGQEDLFTGPEVGRKGLFLAVHHDPDITGVPLIGRTEPDIISFHKADFDDEVDAKFLFFDHAA